MATSIFFTESRDFKLIKSQILSQEDAYLVYLYADTTNIKIPKELIKELPIYGNSLVWVDTADYDATDITNHMILMIGQFVNSEDEVNFFIASRSAKMEKTIYFLRNLGIPVELVTSAVQAAEVKPLKKRKTRKKAAAVVSDESVKEGKRKPGRPKKAEAPAGEEKAKPIRKAKAKKAASKKPKAVKSKAPKSSKPRKPRTEKPITQEEVDAKIARFTTSDPNTEQVMRDLFNKPKVSRPKLESKLIEVIVGIINDSELAAEQVIGQMRDLGVLETGAGGRLKYND